MGNRARGGSAVFGCQWSARTDGAVVHIAQSTQRVDVCVVWVCTQRVTKEENNAHFALADASANLLVPTQRPARHLCPNDKGGGRCTRALLSVWGIAVAWSLLAPRQRSLQRQAVVCAC